MYNKGLGVQLNNKQALDWFEKACNASNQDACNNYRILKQQNY